MHTLQDEGKNIFITSKFSDKTYCDILVDIFVIKRRRGYCACANWKSRANISCRLIASIAQ